MTVRRKPAQRLVTRRVQVTQVVEVTMDESKFDAAFMAEFSKIIVPMTTLDEHARHLAQLTARGVINEFDDHRMIEGYGHRRDMGIALRVVSEEQETEVLP